jgi:hypothetical protein
MQVSEMGICRNNRRLGQRLLQGARILRKHPWLNISFHVDDSQLLFTPAKQNTKQLPMTFVHTQAHI